jgi:hypothetical protein
MALLKEVDTGWTANKGQHENKGRTSGENLLPVV